MSWKRISTAIIGAAALSSGFGAHAQQPTAQPGTQDPVAALTQSVQQGLALIRQYEAESRVGATAGAGRGSRSPRWQ
jgi:hypothetical protein